MFLARGFLGEKSVDITWHRLEFRRVKVSKYTGPYIPDVLQIGELSQEWVLQQGYLYLLLFSILMGQEEVLNHLCTDLFFI